LGAYADFVADLQSVSRQQASAGIADTAGTPAAPGTTTSATSTTTAVPSGPATTAAATATGTSQVLAREQSTAAALNSAAKSLADTARTLASARPQQIAGSLAIPGIAVFL